MVSTEPLEATVAEQVAAGIAEYFEREREESRARRAQVELEARPTTWEVHKIADDHARRQADAALWRGLLYLELYVAVWLFLRWWLRDLPVDGEGAPGGD